jgi:mannose PTS system EIIA component
MIGIVICCHGTMGEGMRNAAELIVGPQKNLDVVSVKPGDGGNDILEALKKAIAKVDTGTGVLLLTDLFGGTPTNISCALLGEANIEVVTGFNLPLLIKAITGRSDTVEIGELARVATEYGQRHMSIAGDLLGSK